jgi:hypothetical protein
MLVNLFCFCFAFWYNICATIRIGLYKKAKTLIVKKLLSMFSHIVRRKGLEPPLAHKFTQQFDSYCFVSYVIGMLLLCDCFNIVFTHSSKKNVCFILSKLHNFFI